MTNHLHERSSNQKQVIKWGSLLFVAAVVIALAFYSFTMASREDGKQIGRAKSNPVKKDVARESSSSAIDSTAASDAAQSRVYDEGTSSLATTPMVGEIEVGGKKHELTGSDGLFDRVMVEAKVSIPIKVAVPNLTVGQEIIVSAPNGGNISATGKRSLRFKADEASRNLELVFQPGVSLGAYSVIIMHQGVSQTLDFWVGPPHPLGEPGPSYSSINNK